MSRQKRSLLVSFLIGFLFLWAGQWTKGLAVRFLKNQEPVAVIKGVFEFSYLENRGAAFGMRRTVSFFSSDRNSRIGSNPVYDVADAGNTEISSVSSMPDAGSRRGSRQYDRPDDPELVVDFLYFRLIDFPVF